MNLIRNICVYCGSAPGADPLFLDAALELGRALAAHDIGLVYGGGDNGLMGAVARAVLAEGGRVTGIIPSFLRKRENMLEAAQELIIVDDMHSRKRIMFERADAFVALPGGIGTLEELVEQLTWVQLGQHGKPVLIAEIAGIWKRLHPRAVRAQLSRVGEDWRCDPDVAEGSRHGRAHRQDKGTRRAPLGARVMQPPCAFRRAFSSTSR